MHTVFALLCFVVVIHWLVFPYPSGLLHWHCGNLTIAPVAAKQPWRIWINTSCEFIMNDCITTTKQSTTKLCAYLLGYTVSVWWPVRIYICCVKLRLFHCYGTTWLRLWSGQPYYLNPMHSLATYCVRSTDHEPLPHSVWTITPNHRPMKITLKANQYDLCGFQTWHGSYCQWSSDYLCYISRLNPHFYL